MANTQAMKAAILAFKTQLFSELENYFKSLASSDELPVLSFPDKLLECYERILKPTLLTCLEDERAQERVVTWWSLAECYRDELESVLNKLLLRKFFDGLDISPSHVLDYMKFQQSFVGIKDILAYCRQPESTHQSHLFVRKPIQDYKQFLTSPRSNTLSNEIVPLTTKDLQPYAMAWPKDAVDFDFSLFNSQEIVNIIQMILSDFKNLESNFSFLQKTMIAFRERKDVIFSVESVQAILESQMTPVGRLNQRDYQQSTTAWLESIRDLPGFDISKLTCDELPRLLISDILHWINQNNSLPYIEYQKMDHDKRLSLVYEFLEESAAHYQYRNSGKAVKLNALNNQYQRLNLLKYRWIIESCEKIFSAIVENTLNFLPTPLASANFVNIWLQLRLNQDSNGKRVFEKFIEIFTHQLTIHNPQGTNWAIDFLKHLRGSACLLFLDIIQNVDGLQNPEIVSLMFSNSHFSNAIDLQMKSSVPSRYLSTFFSALSEKLIALSEDELMAIIAGLSKESHAFMKDLISKKPELLSRFFENKRLAAWFINRNILKPHSIMMIKNISFNFIELIDILRQSDDELIQTEVLAKLKILINVLCRDEANWLSPEQRAVVTDLLQSYDERGLAIPDNIMLVLSRVFQTKKQSLALMRMNNDFHQFTELPVLFMAIMKCALTRTAFIADLHRENLLTSQHLEVLIEEAPSSCLSALITEDEQVRETIKKDLNLAKKAITRQFDSVYSYTLLDECPFTAGDLSELMMENLQDVKLVSLLTSKFAPKRWNVKIQVLNNLLIQIRSGKLLEVVADRYQDYDHIHSLLGLTEPEKEVDTTTLATVNSLLSNEITVKSLQENIELQTLLDIAFVSEKFEVVKTLLQRVIFPKFEAKILTQLLTSDDLSRTILRLIGAFRHSLALVKLIQGDLFLKKSINRDIVSVILTQDIFEDSYGEAGPVEPTTRDNIEAKLNFLRDEVVISQLSQEEWLMVLNDDNLKDPSLVKEITTLLVARPLKMDENASAEQEILTHLLNADVSEEKMVESYKAFLSWLESQNRIIKKGDNLRSTFSRSPVMNVKYFDQIKNLFLTAMNATRVQALILSEDFSLSQMSYLLELLRPTAIISQNFILDVMSKKPHWPLPHLTMLLEQIPQKLELFNAAGLLPLEREPLLCKTRVLIAYCLSIRSMHTLSYWENARHTLLKHIADKKHLPIAENKSKDKTNADVLSAYFIPELVSILSAVRLCEVDEIRMIFTSNPHFPLHYLQQLMTDNLGRKEYVNLLCEFPQLSGEIKAYLLNMMIQKFHLNASFEHLKLEFLVHMGERLNESEVNKLMVQLCECKLAYDTIYGKNKSEIMKISMDDLSNYVQLARELKDSYCLNFPQDIPLKVESEENSEVYLSYEWAQPLFQIWQLIKTEHQLLRGKGWLILENGLEGVPPTGFKKQIIELSQKTLEEIARHLPHFYMEATFN